MVNSSQLALRDILRNPITLEFLGLESQDVYTETKLESDNPPVGLLLCTEYGETTVQYATEGLSQNLFVSKYLLQLPSEEEMRRYLLDSVSEKDWEEYRKEKLQISPNSD